MPMYLYSSIMTGAIQKREVRMKQQKIVDDTHINTGQASSNQAKFVFHIHGLEVNPLGDYPDRTNGLQIFSLALSQLS